MTFSELLLSAIQQSEIPLRYEPGAEEAVAEPVTRVLVAWVEAHMPGNENDEYARDASMRSHAASIWTIDPESRLGRHCFWPLAAFFSGVTPSTGVTGWSKSGAAGARCRSAMACAWRL